MLKLKIVLVFSLYFLLLGISKGRKKHAFEAFPKLPVYMNFRFFLREYNCHVRTSNGKIITFYSPEGALARWEKIQIRCKKLEEDFYAARCLNLNCNLGEFDITKPQGVSVETSPVFVVSHLDGMPVRAKVLVPNACYCKVVS